MLKLGACGWALEGLVLGVVVTYGKRGLGTLYDLAGQSRTLKATLQASPTAQAPVYMHYVIFTDIDIANCRNDQDRCRALALKDAPSPQ